MSPVFLRFWLTAVVAHKRNGRSVPLQAPLTAEAATVADVKVWNTNRDEVVASCDACGKRG